nr:DNRLRE domain-containing protein [uncultured Pedobacter sp.]
MNRTFTNWTLKAYFTFSFLLWFGMLSAQTVFNATDEASVYVGNTTHNYEGSDFQVKDANNGYTQRLAYVKFDLGTTKSTQVGTATLRLYCIKNAGGSTPTKITTFSTSPSWSEGTLTYGNKPNFEAPLSVSTVGAAGSYYEWDVTNYVKELVKNNSIASFGLSDEDKIGNQIILYQKSIGSDYLPELVISATPNPNPVNIAPVIPNQLFSDGMILQQSKASTSIYGKAGIGSNITVTPSWNNTPYTATATTDVNGKWKVDIATPTAVVGAGPYTVNIKDADGHSTTITNVQIGEVWFCAGQSNMEMRLKGFGGPPPTSPIKDGDAIIAAANDVNIRMFTLPTTLAYNPQADLSGTWNEANPSNAFYFSAIAYQYALALKQKLGIPVGVIVSAVGGIPIQSLMSRESLQPFSEVTLPDANTAIDKSTPTSVFNGMVSPVVDYGIKGFIWYQGESNRQEPYLYKKLFPALIADYRSKWNDNNLPFYFVQIAPNNYSVPEGGARMREVQYDVYKATANTGISIPMEVGEASEIHYADKTTPANRLAYIALNRDYGYTSTPYLGPEYSSVSFTGNVATLSFNHADGLQFKGNTASLFEIAGADKVFYPATAIINNITNQIEVSSTSVATPVAVRYAFSNFVVGNLFNGDNLPASTFRTIDWDPEALPIELSSFTGKATNNGIALKWTTASEKNNHYFELLKSTDGKNFKTIATIKGAGDSDQKLFYDFTDLEPVSGVNYYQLKQVDFDGESSTSQLIAVKYSLSIAKVSVYPNPATASLNIQLPTYNTKETTLSLSDLTGKTVIHKSVSANQNVITLSVADMARGLYILELKTTDNIVLLTEKVILR